MLVLIGGYCQRGVFLSCLYPPLTRKNMKKTHVYGFEAKEYYISIKAESLKEAIEKFCIMFGEYHFKENVYSIHICKNC